jgi:hypothetical protein
MLVTPAVLPTVGPGGLQFGLPEFLFGIVAQRNSGRKGIPVEAERNQNLAFSATWHAVYKPDIWD